MPIITNGLGKISKWIGIIVGSMLILSGLLGAGASLFKSDLAYNCSTENKTDVSLVKIKQATFEEKLNGYSDKIGEQNKKMDEMMDLIKNQTSKIEKLTIEVYKLRRKDGKDDR